MITLKFPTLEKALSKNVKEAPLNSPMRGIIVLNQKAIVFQHSFCLVVDLYDYFTLDCGIEEDEELKTLEGILMYMNEKIFSGEFWNELTKGSNMKMNMGSLYVENPRYSKDLHYKEIDIDIIEPLSQLTKANDLKDGLVNCIAVPFGVLKTIYDTLPASFKSDTILLEFSTQDSLVKFTFQDRKHFFGYIKPNYDAAQEGFRFDAMDFFVNEYQEHLAELKTYSIPPGPSELPEMIIEEVEVDENQESLF